MGNSVVKESYSSPDYLAREYRKLWPKVWQSVCREEELTGAGDYVTYEIGNESVIVMRAASGKLRAYHNVCQHRGRRLQHVATRSAVAVVRLLQPRHAQPRRDVAWFDGQDGFVERSRLPPCPGRLVPLRQLPGLGDRLHGRPSGRRGIKHSGKPRPGVRSQAKKRPPCGGRRGEKAGPKAASMSAFSVGWLSSTLIR